MKRIRPWLTGYCYGFIAFFIFSSASASTLNKPRRVLILPMAIHSQKDMSFLNMGIMDMLASRISRSADVIRASAPTANKTPLQMGRALAADFVVSGSVTFLGNRASTDVSLIRVDNGKTVVRLDQLGESSGDALLHISQFAGRVQHYLDSPSASEDQPAAPMATLPEMAIPPTPSRPAPVPSPQPVAGKASQAPAPTAATVAATPEADALWIGPPVKGVINAMATGDVNGDGRPEIAYALDNRIVVVNRAGNRLNRLTGLDVGQGHRIIALDIGDVNGNGRAEILVTRLNSHNKLSSVVLEWNRAGLTSIAGKQKWYFRASDVPGKGRILMGQRQGSPSVNDTGGLYRHPFFFPGIFELAWTGRGFQAASRLRLPDNLNIYGFARGSIFNDGNIQTIAYSSEDTLRIYDADGNPQWAGEEILGGNPVYLESASSTDGRSQDRTYLNQRLVVADIDADGKSEVVTVHNHDVARRFVKRFRKYTRGRMIALQWNRVGMKTVWKGEAISGYISDFSLADLNGDGRLETVYAKVTATGIAQVESSQIVVERIEDSRFSQE